MVKANTLYANTEMRDFTIIPHVLWLSVSGVTKPVFDDKGSKADKPFGKIYALHLTKWVTLSFNTYR